LALSGPADMELYREALHAADQAADTMTRIVQDLLLLARSDAGKLGLELQPTSLREVLERAAAAVPKSEGAPICLLLPEEPVQVMADTHHLVRLFVNLLENAERHTPADGRIEVEVAPGSGRAPVAVRVRDTGEGIPPEHLPHVCERFYRIDASRARSGHPLGGGTGLGLAICRSIAEAHGGTLQVESEVGRGTTVTVTLRRAAGVAEPERVPAVAG
ncbi:MAG TPA: HAMP domain-containing sensor histidine kinase, partial [Armatimonadota bacterium]|nr:HAMP domain-containing sensor histidine kinase [Armatimonadota bacterium]